MLNPFKIVGDVLAKTHHSFLAASSRAIRNTVSDFCPLDGIINEHTFQGSYGSCVTVFKVNGTVTGVADEEKLTTLEKLYEFLEPTLRQPNQIIEFIYQYDYESAKAQVKKAHELYYKKFEKVGLDASFVLDERVKVLSDNAKNCELFIAITTLPIGLLHPKQINEHVRKQLTDLGPDFQESWDGMQLYLHPLQIVQKHTSICNQLISSLSQLKYKAVMLNLDEAICTYGEMLYSGVYKNSFTPKTDNNIKARYYNVDPNAENIPGEMFFNPSLGDQLASKLYMVPNEGMTEVARINDRYIAAVSLVEAPARPSAFEDLILSLTTERQPFRISIALHGGDDLHKANVNSTKYTAIMGNITCGIGLNKKQHKGSDALLAYGEKGPLVGVSVVATTWGKTLSECQGNIRNVQRAIDTWGGGQCEIEIGDTVLAYTATLPGWSNNLRQIVVMPLKHALKILPTSKLYSPYVTGSVFLDDDMNMTCFQLIGEETQTWNWTSSAPPGGGKSVLLQRLLFDAIGDPTNPDLPKVLIVDVGRSSENLILCLQGMAKWGKERFKFLAFDSNLGINPLDIRLACDEPTDSEINVVNSIIRLIFADPETGKLAEGMAEFINLLVKSTYVFFSSIEPKKFDETKHPEIEQWLIKNEIKFTNKTTWRQIRDIAMRHENYEIAKLAHLQFVPCINDLTTVITKSPDIKSQYKDDDPIIQKATRAIIAFTNEFPSFSEPSTFFPEAPDILVVDVTAMTRDKSPAGKRRANIAYTMARYFGKDFLVHEDMLKTLPVAAREYYKTYIQQNALVKKYLVYDEFHTVKGLHATEMMIEDDMRNGRKFKLSVGLASQSASDYSDIIRQVAPISFILRPGDAHEVEELAERYSWSSSTQRLILRKITGAPNFFLHITGFKPGKILGASMSQAAKNLIGNIERTLLASSREDVALKKQLERNGIPFKDSIRAIAAIYPGGVESVVSERTRALLGDNSSSLADQESKDEALKNILATLTQEVIREYQRMKREEHASA